MSLSKHKRPSESSTSGGEGGGQRNSKRPAPSMSNLENHEINGSAGYFSLGDIGQVVREAVKQANSDLIALIDSRIQDALKAFIPQIHTVLKNVIQEPVCKGMDHANLHSSELVKRTLPESTQTADTGNLRLRFKSNLSLPLYTGMQLKGQQGCPILVELIDANTGRVVTSGPESTAKLDVVVLKGDFDQEENSTWSVTEFEKYIVKEREGRRPLLTGSGKLQVKLEEGIGKLGDLMFTDNSSWNSCRKFRIGVKVASGSCEGIRVHEAITEAFTVRDRRGEVYKKHHPPASDDEIHRLEEIGKGGVYCKRLNEEGIHKVEELVRILVGDSKILRNILGSGMPEKKWNNLIDHAKECVPNGKSYVYYVDDKKDYGIVISNICELKGLIDGREYHTTDQLSDSQEAHAKELVKAASKNWNHVEEFRAGTIARPVLSKSSSACPGELPMNQQPCPDPSDCCLTQWSFPRIESSDAPLGSSVPISGGLTVGFLNVNCNNGDGITPPSLMLPHKNLTSTVVPEQGVGPWNQQQILANEGMQYTEAHEFQEPIKSLSPYLMEDILLSPAYDYFENNLPEDVDMFDNTGMGSSSDPRFGTKGIGRGVVCWLMLKAIFMWGGFIKRNVPERFVELE